MKQIAEKFHGLFAFIVTPTEPGTEAIDLPALRRFIDFQIESGVDGITVFGSTGGIGSFTEAERQQVIEAAARHIDGRVPLVAGTGAIQTSESVRLSKFAADAGADAVLVVPINYWRLTDDELLSHYEEIARASDLPLGVYNNPGTTGIDMKPELIARLSEIDTVAFVKESSGDVKRVTAITSLTRGSIAVLNGSDAIAPAAIAAGAHGWFAGSCSIMPALCARLFGYGRQGDMDQMRKTFAPMFPICSFMSAKGYIRVAHAACDLLGRPMGAPRRPIQGLSNSDLHTLRILLADAGLCPAASLAA